MKSKPFLKFWQPAFARMMAVGCWLVLAAVTAHAEDEELIKVLEGATKEHFDEGLLNQKKTEAALAEFPTNPRAKIAEKDLTYLAVANEISDKPRAEKEGIVGELIARNTFMINNPGASENEIYAEGKRARDFLRDSNDFDQSTKFLLSLLDKSTAAAIKGEDGKAAAASAGMEAAAWMLNKASHEVERYFLFHELGIKNVGQLSADNNLVIAELIKQEAKRPASLKRLSSEHGFPLALEGESLDKFSRYNIKDVNSYLSFKEDKSLHADLNKLQTAVKNKLSFIEAQENRFQNAEQARQKLAEISDDLRPLRTSIAVLKALTVNESRETRVAVSTAGYLVDAGEIMYKMKIVKDLELTKHHCRAST